MLQPVDTLCLQGGKSWDVLLAGSGDAGDTGHSVCMVGPKHRPGPGEQAPRGAPGRRAAGQAAGVCLAAQHSVCSLRSMQLAWGCIGAGV